MTSGSAPGPLRSPPLSSAGTSLGLWASPHSSPPPQPWDGTTPFLLPPGRLPLLHALSTYFLQFIRAHNSLETPPCTRSTPPSWPSLCRPEAVVWPRPLSSPFSHHFPSPHHTLVIPPGVLLPSTSPPPLICLARVRGDLPLGVAPCVPES